MEETIRNVIFKYLNIFIEDTGQNLLTFPVLLEYWPYVLIELQEVYHFPIIQVIEQMSYDEFTLEILCERLTQISIQ